jgi:4'-phosphopantetheinyl transferase
VRALADVSIWCLELARIGAAPMRALLSGDEQARADRFRQAGDRERFTKGRGALRLILGERTGHDPCSLALVEGDGHKPALRDHPSVQFNLSHSGGFVLIAVGEAPLGVDIEQIKPGFEWRPLAAMNFHPDERATLAPLDGEDARAAFFQAWTHKEAFLKATGIGLTNRLTEINIARGGGAVQAPADLALGKWYATPLSAPEGYKASVVTGMADVAIQDRTAMFAPA